MRGVHLSDELAQIEFAKKAAAHFALHPEHSTYTGEEIKPGCLFAVRWGLCDDCVLVLKLDETHVPTNYFQLVRSKPAQS